jgi:hypothetical protein
MAKIIDLIETIQDIEMREWLTAFFTNKYGVSSLERDPERWLSDTGNSLTPRHDQRWWYGGFAEYEGAFRPKVALYELVSVLYKSP